MKVRVMVRVRVRVRIRVKVRVRVRFRFRVLSVKNKLRNELLCTLKVFQGFPRLNIIRTLPT